MPFFVVIGALPSSGAREYSITVEKTPHPTQTAAEARARAAAPDDIWRVIEAADGLTAARKVTGAPPPPWARRG